jgi:predicted peptidase
MDSTFAKRVHRSGSLSLPYRLHIPDAGKGPFPLVLFLHGVGERGTDNESQMLLGIGWFACGDVLARHPCVVVAPQCPPESTWVDAEWSAPSHVMAERPTPALLAAFEMVRKLQDELPVDRERTYITGMSMGGFGTWDAIQRWPHFFAAAVPVCGGGDPARARAIAHMPIWVFHGAQDPVVQPRRSRDMVRALWDAGSAPGFTEYPHVGHNAWDFAYKDAAMVEWLFSRTK